MKVEHPKRRLRVNGRAAGFAAAALLLLIPQTAIWRAVAWGPFLLIAGYFAATRGKALLVWRDMSKQRLAGATIAVPVVLETPDAEAWPMLPARGFLRPLAVRYRLSATLLDLPDGGLCVIPGFAQTLLGWNEATLAGARYGGARASIDVDEDGDPTDTGLCVLMADDGRALRMDVFAGAFDLAAAIGQPFDSAVDWDMGVFGATPSERFPDRDEAARSGLIPVVAFPDDELNPDWVAPRDPRENRDLSPAEIEILGSAAASGVAAEYGDAGPWTVGGTAGGPAAADETLDALVRSDLDDSSGDPAGAPGWFDDPWAPGVRERRWTGTRWSQTEVRPMRSEAAWCPPASDGHADGGREPRA